MTYVEWEIGRGPGDDEYSLKGLLMITWFCNRRSKKLSQDKNKS